MSIIPTLEASTNRLRKLLETATPVVESILKHEESGPQAASRIIYKFLSQPLIVPLMGPSFPVPKAGEPSDPTPATELASIQSSLQQLTRAVNSLNKAHTPSPDKAKPPKGGSPPAKPPSPTYSAVAGSRPLNASIILDLAQTHSAHAFRPRPVEVCGLINDALKTSPHQQVSISAVRWTAKGNLVVIGGHNVSLSHLQLAAPTIAQAFINSYAATVNPTPPPARANVKWSKLLINGLPTGASDTQESFTPEECHHTLVANNPTYANLTVTQKPSWVRAPSSYKAGSSSSLVVAFEDQDGMKLKSLLSARHLYAFGTRATVRKWKQRTTKPTNTRITSAPSIESEDESEDDVIIQTQAQPPTSELAQPQRPTTSRQTRKPKAK